ncbi:MAG: hypothetical protein ABI867_17405 [Kofleriaceae bacterium]
MIARVAALAALAAGCAASSDDSRGAPFDPHAAAPPADYDPIEHARASLGQLSNEEASTPAFCYTQAEGKANTCFACHTRSAAPNFADDWELQQNYSFTDYAKTNHWKNQFRERSELVAKYSDDDVLGYIRGNNYAPLQRWLADHPGAPGWHPDLDFARGFDPAGFASDGSGWRAIRYKPFLGSFWATNGSTDDVFVRLPDEFRGTRAIYQTNLAILELAIASDPKLPPGQLVRAIEPIDETAGGIDLDGDGTLATATRIAGLPAHYAGAASAVLVVRGLYPQGTEFLHTVRYIDPDAPSSASTRMKEVRYAKKTRLLSESQLVAAYAAVESSDAPQFTGDALTGVSNPFSWQLQGWIEDSRGWLRKQTDEEHQFCMGCHTNLGATVDQTFAFARKVPGLAGWQPQDARGIPDAPELGQTAGEYAQYLERTGGGDELRANAEVHGRFFIDGQLDPARVAALRTDITELVTPSRARAIALDRAYLANVIEQSYVWGREASTSPAKHAMPKITQRTTGLGEADRVYRDYKLLLDWH